MSTKISAPAAIDASDVQNLSFVTGADFWTPDRHGEYEVDCARGRAYALELVTFMRQHGNPAIFGSVVRAITGSGVYGAVEIGFCGRMGIELIGLPGA